MSTFWESHITKENPWEMKKGPASKVLLQIIKSIRAPFEAPSVQPRHGVISSKDSTSSVAKTPTIQLECTDYKRIDIQALIFHFDSYLKRLDLFWNDHIRLDILKTI
ncbi:hypothetical protein YC2023_054151 [Brassica napus]